MSLKAVNIKMDESKIIEVKSVASAFHMTMTEVITEALDEYLAKMKRDPYYRLTANIEEASEEESAEILEELNKLTDDDLKIVRTKSFRS